MAIPLPSFKLKHTTHCWIQSNARKRNYYIYFYIQFCCCSFRLFVLGFVRYCCCAIYTNRRCAIDSLCLSVSGAVCVLCLGLLCVAVVVNKYQLIVIWDYDAVDMAGVWLTDRRPPPPPPFLLYISVFCVCVSFSHLKNSYHCGHCVWAMSTPSLLLPLLVFLTLLPRRCL